MSSYVCDRCGAAPGTCHHAVEQDYVLQPRHQYEQEMLAARVALVCVVCCVAIVAIALST